jgi:hypothetical protein
VGKEIQGLEPGATLQLIAKIVVLQDLQLIAVQVKAV